METTIRINTDSLNMDILEGLKKMFPHKKVKITVTEEFEVPNEEFIEVTDEDIKNSPSYIEGDEDATQYFLNRPKLAAELERRIKGYEENKEDVITLNIEDLIK